MDETSHAAEKGGVDILEKLVSKGRVMLDDILDCIEARISALSS